MFDIGWTELLLIGVVALIVIGPKDLPEMFRTLGRFTAKLRSMSRDFSRAMEQAAKESGVKDVADDLKAATSPSSLGLNAVKDAAAKFEKWDPLKSAKPATPARPAMPVTLPAGDKAVVAPVVAEPVIAAPAAPEPVTAAPAAPEPVTAAPAATPAATLAKAAPKPRAAKAAVAAEPAAVPAAKKPRAPRKKAES